MADIHEQDLKECEYCEQSYYEYDTGYSEYECDLWGCECFGGGIGNGCPLSFKYKIE